MSYHDDSKPLPGSAFEKIDLLETVDTITTNNTSSRCDHVGLSFIGIGSRGDWACKVCGKWKKDIDKEREAQESHWDDVDLNFETFDDEEIDFGQCD
jgi:tRNA(Ile2) C34 agmatinyltransferase TiaS